MAGVHHRLGRQYQQPTSDRVQDGRKVGERPAGRPRAATEQGVAAEQHRFSADHSVQAHSAGGVPWGVHDMQPTAARDREPLAVGELEVGRAVGIDRLPQHQIRRTQGDRSPYPGSQLNGRVDVVVVPVCGDDHGYMPSVDRGEDHRRVVRGVDDQYLGVIPDQPDVVVDREALAVDQELAAGDDPIDSYPVVSRHALSVPVTEQLTTG